MGSTSQHVMQLSIRIQSSNDLVLGRHIKFFHHAVKFLAQFDILRVQCRNLAILLCEQEFQILHLILRLSALSFPFKIGAISVLSILDELEVQIVVLLDNPLIFML